MANLALVVKKDKYPIATYHDTEKFGHLVTQIDSNLFFNDSLAGLFDRVFAETDSSYLQVIPYITLINENNEIFIYTRGNLSEEGRLTGKCSIGLGGHIEESPSDTKTLRNIIDDAAHRELLEEVGIDYDFSNAVYSIVYSPSDPVGAVHLAVMTVIHVKSTDLGEMEAGVITKGKWVNLSLVKDYKDYMVENALVFEPWSDLLLTGILNGINANIVDEQTI